MRKVRTIVVALIMVMAMSASVFAAGVTKDGAKKIALKNAKLTKSQVSNITVKYDRDDAEYDVKFKSNKNGARFSFEIKKSSGKIVEKSIDYKYKRNSSRKKIGKLAAQKIAANKAGANLSAVKKGKCEYDYDDGEGIYEVEFRSGKYKYDIEIQAPTGKITDYNWEYLRR